MNTFRTRRPLLVNATQCLHPTLIHTDSGQRRAYPGDWIIEGENHERYIVDNTFFTPTWCNCSSEPLAGRSMTQKLHSPPLSRHIPSATWLLQTAISIMDDCRQELPFAI